MGRRDFKGWLGRLGIDDTGSNKWRVLLLLASVLALDSADKDAVSATADNLQRAFGIGTTQVGLLLTVVSLVAAAGTLPIGVLTDRVNRTRLLAGSVVLWAIAMIFSGAAQSFNLANTGHPASLLMGAGRGCPYRTAHPGRSGRSDVVRPGFGPGVRRQQPGIGVYLPDFFGHPAFGRCLGANGT